MWKVPDTESITQNRGINEVVDTDNLEHQEGMTVAQREDHDLEMSRER